MKNKNLSLETISIHGGNPQRSKTGALENNICQTATYRYEDKDSYDKALELEEKGLAHIYTRCSNPTTLELEKCIAEIEKGACAVATASGSAAISTVLSGLLKSGDHLIASKNMYFYTEMFINEKLKDTGVEVSFVNATDTEEIKKSLKKNTKVIFLESPLNPSTRLVNIEYCANIAHDIGAVLVVDSTLAPPPVQFPIELGADYVVHSLTKYYNGHGDTLGGIIVANERVKDTMYDMRNLTLACVTGASISPMNSWLIRRGIKTLKLRVRKHCDNALALATFLENNDFIEYVHYPALKSHPDYDLCKKQMNGLGSGIVSFKFKENINGRTALEAASMVLNNFKICSIAVSLGETDTLVYSEDSVIPGYVRIAVGLEDIDDLINDFDQALDILKN